MVAPENGLGGSTFGGGADTAGARCTLCGRDVQWEIPIPSLPYGFKLFPPGNFPYGNSREIPEIREFPELREFPVLRESREFPSHGKFSFLSAHISDFQSVFALESLFYDIFNYIYNLLYFVTIIEISFLEEGGVHKR